MELTAAFESILQAKPFCPPLKSNSDQALYEKLTALGISSAPLINVLEELVINGREHGVKGLQIYCAIEGKHLLFATSDKGPGIHQTVPRNPKLADTINKTPAAIIRLALEEGITGTGVTGRGVGLYLLSEYVRRTGSEAIVCSDGGLVRQQGAKFHEESSSKNWDGCIICLKAQIA